MPLMKLVSRFVTPFMVLTVVVVSAFVAGCTDNQLYGPFEQQEPAAEPAEQDYFGYKKGDTTYVFSSAESRDLFVRDGILPNRVRRRELGGRTVVFENRSYTDYQRLMRQYRQAHKL